MSVLRGRGPAFGIALGFVTGLLIAGLAFPLVFGHTKIETAGALGTDGGPSATTGVEGGSLTPVTTGRESSGAVRAASRDRPSAPGAVSTGGRSVPTGTKLTATDRGVTANSIKIGLLIADPSGGAQLGIDFSALNPDTEKAAYKAFIDDINAHGGILGRKIEPIYRVFDVFSEDDTQAACREVTEDHKVFAAFNFYGMDGYKGTELCVTKVGKTPLFKGIGSWHENMVASKGYLSTSGASTLRMNLNLMWELHRMGALKGKRIGVLGGSGAVEDTTKADTDAAIRLLKSLGYKIEYVAYLSDDFTTAQSQVPTIVNEMKAKDIQVLPLLTNWVTNTSFVQNAEAQRWFPQYAVNDWTGNSWDLSTQGMPRSYNGAISITSERHGERRAGLPVSATDRRCIDVYNRSSGDNVQHTDEPNGYIVTSLCAIAQRFRDAATLTGAELTRDRLVGSIQSIGATAIPGTGGGSYSRGKFDGADYVRTKRFNYSCTCYEVTTKEFRRSKF